MAMIQISKSKPALMQATSATSWHLSRYRQRSAGPSSRYRAGSLTRPLRSGGWKKDIRTRGGSACSASFPNSIWERTCKRNSIAQSVLRQERRRGNRISGTADVPKWSLGTRESLRFSKAPNLNAIQASPHKNPRTPIPHRPTNQTPSHQPLASGQPEPHAVG